MHDNQDCECCGGDVVLVLTRGHDGRAGGLVLRGGGGAGEEDLPRRGVHVAQR